MSAPPRVLSVVGSTGEGEAETPAKGRTVWWLGRKHSEEARRKISEKNKGNVPWNKGRCHSEETKRKIRERTKLAMSRPEVREKVAKHAASSPRRELSAQALERKRELCRVNALIRAASCRSSSRVSLDKVISRRDVVGFQWPKEVVARLNEELITAWSVDAYRRARILESTPPPPSLSSRGSRSRVVSEITRAKLRESIRTLWKDPSYRSRVLSSMRQSQADGRRELSQDHRDRIRRSLLRRNEEMRRQGIRPSRRLGASRRRNFTEEEREARRQMRHKRRRAELAKRREERAREVEEQRLQSARDQQKRREDRAMVKELVAVGILPSLGKELDDVDDDVEPVNVDETPDIQEAETPISAMARSESLARNVDFDVVELDEDDDDDFEYYYDDEDEDDGVDAPPTRLIVQYVNGKRAVVQSDAAPDDTVES